MIEMNVICEPVMKFNNGVVTGEIHVEADSLLTAIMTNLDLPYNGELKVSVKNLITETSIQYIKADQPKYIVLKDGVVTNYDRVRMTMHQAMYLIDVYVAVLLPDEKSRRRQKDMKNYSIFKDLVYKCDDCKCLGDTANICRLVNKK